MIALTPDRSRKPLLLVVDDVPANLHVLASALRTDYRVKTATSGRVALELAAREDRPDLILLDVMMPEMSGHEVLHELRGDPSTREIPVIFVTADASEGNEIECIEEGARDFLTKPINAPILRARVRNLLGQREMQRQIELQDVKLRAMLDSSMQFIGLLDPQGRVLHVNRQVHELLGLQLDRLIGVDFTGISLWQRVPGQLEAVRNAVAAGAQGLSSRFETRHVRHDGSELILDFSLRPVWDADGQVVFLLPEATDVTRQKQAEESIRRLANYDPLTGLPNRTLLTDRVSQAIRVAERNSEPLGLMFLDVDRFKHINDTLGHATGDRLLIEVAARLVASVRMQDTVARLGGDEFVLLLPNTHAGGAMVVAEKLLERISERCLIDQHELAVTSSIGIATFPGDGRDFATLSKSADVAMYRAKREGRNTFRFYTQEMQERSSRALQMESLLRHAIERNELVLHYQPQVELDSGDCHTVEALLRWQSCELGLVSPADFIPLAEESGLILPIGEWVLRSATQQARRWLDAGSPIRQVAVNLSSVQLRQQDLPATVAQCLREAGLPPGHLELELTESTAFSNPENAFAMLAELHACGVRLSIDDFGTGYSSLSYLKRIHIDKLKIDQSFVRDLGRDREDEALVDAIINMARALGLKTVAEGVETTEQLECLRQRGCDVVQGFHFSRPLPTDELETWLRRREAARLRAARCEAGSRHSA